MGTLHHGKINPVDSISISYFIETKSPGENRIGKKGSTPNA